MYKRQAKEKLSKTEYERFWPFIIDDSMAIDDCPEWMKKDECFNLRRFKSPYVLARDIEQKFRKLFGVQILRLDYLTLQW